MKYRASTKSRNVRGNVGAILSCLTLLGACGGPESADKNSEKATASPGTSTSAAQGSSNLIEAFEVTTSDLISIQQPPKAPEMSLTGGCTHGSPLSIGFLRGTPNAADYFYVSFDSVDPVVSGQTGEIQLTNITLDNGVETPANMPADSQFKVPVRFEGDGVLLIQSQSGVGMAGKMKGVVNGTVSGVGAENGAEVTVSFEIDLACAH
ncbi:MAG: hypothetical protein R3C52_11690 [Hyphomonadaceae bacterium]